MKLLHLSDLHVGKNLHHYSLKEDQEYVFNQIIERAKEEAPEACLICGDVYDKSVPSAEAVSLFDSFLTGLCNALPNMTIMIIAGNHDSGERLDYASDLLKKQHIFIAGRPPGDEKETLQKVTLQDEYGEIDFYLLPFFKPSYVRKALKEEVISYDVALKGLIEREAIDFKGRRNVLLTHQFYVAGLRLPQISDSETKSVGGLDQVDIRLVKDFDYVALGHIHKAQPVGFSHIRYCGAPLKYSASESKHTKSISIVTLKEKGTLEEIKAIPLNPLHELHVIKGYLHDLLTQETGVKRTDYVSVTLLDSKELFKPKEQLMSRYERILAIQVDNEVTRRLLEDIPFEDSKETPFALFSHFFTEMQGRDMTKQEKEAAENLFKEL